MYDFLVTIEIGNQGASQNDLRVLYALKGLLALRICLLIAATNRYFTTLQVKTLESFIAFKKIIWC
jgi:hypothetical protein